MKTTFDLTRYVIKFSFIMLLCYIVCVTVLGCVGGDGFFGRQIINEEPSYPPQSGNVGQLVNGATVCQTFVSEFEAINAINVIAADYGTQQEGLLNVQVLDAQSKDVLFENELDIARLQFYSPVNLLEGAVLRNTHGKTLALCISSPTGTNDHAITLYIEDKPGAGQTLTRDGDIISGSLCFSVDGIQLSVIGEYYIPAVFLIGLALCGAFAWLIIQARRGKSNAALRAMVAFHKYDFLFKQLVKRDFKAKYKRSVLGMFWSFLNPLLTMMVQYVVFSTLFRSDISNFPVYLLCGIVVFSFFSESSSMALTSIVGNAALINKVYVPKYLYPISRVVSSTINFLLSLIPLAMVMLITRTTITPAILLLPFGVACLITFCIGASLLLSTLMVFFRDTQFLWGVLTMIIMYMTPIFYPETIIPDKFLVLFKMNPLFHYVRFNRAIILQGISPEPKAYLFCLIFAIGMLAIGAYALKKNQDKFVLYL